MKNPSHNLLILIFCNVLLAGNLFGQDWNFVKEKDGIKVFTKKEQGNNLKSFKATTDVHSTIEKVYNLIGNVDNHDWWDKNLSEIRVLLKEKDKHYQYYLVYDVPWPLSDRDLCVDARVTTDPVTGKRVISATPLPNMIPEKPECVRIKKYWQRWTIIPMDKGVIRLILEGFVDPGGSVPDWLYNMVITDTPLKVMRGVKARVE
jgi:hypothetical protein